MAGESTGEVNVADRAPIAEDGAKRPSWVARNPRATDWVVSVLLVVASLAMVVWQVPHHKMVSPIDEYIYIDYLDKVPSQLVVHRGEETGDYARHYLSCHGVRMIGFYPESFCSHWQASDEARMPNGGETTADLYTPVYFAATWLLAQPLRLLGVQDITEAGRYTGVVWLSAAAVLLYLSLRRMRVHVVVAGAMGLLIVGSLSAYWSNTYISTDATSLLAGALMVFCLTMFERASRAAPWIFVTSAVLITLAKLQNLMGVAAAAVVLITWAVIDVVRRSAPGRWRALIGDRRVVSAITATVLSVVAQGGWLVLRSMIADGPSADQGIASPFSKTALVQELMKFLPGVANGAVDPSAVGLAAQVAATLMSWTVVAGVIGLIAVSRRGSRSESIALGTFFVALVSGPALALATVVTTGAYFHLPARYAMSLLPFFLLCAGLLFTRSIWTRWMTPVAAVISYAAVMSITG